VTDARALEAPSRPPQPGGPARAVLVTVSPRRLFLHWVLDPSLTAILERATGPAEVRLEVAAAGGDFVEAARHPFDFRAPSWYLPGPRSDCLVRARLGVIDAGAFRSLLVSDPVRMPRDKPGDAPERWSTLADLRGARPPRPAARTAGPPARAAAPAGPARPAAPARTAAPPPALRPAPPMPAAPSPIAASSPASGFAPRAGAGAPPAAGAVGAGDVAFVLHGHLPFVRHPERPTFLEENWLFEAITETYLPILAMLDHLGEDGVDAAITCSISPTLAAMLRDPLLLGRYEAHLEKLLDLARREVGRTRRDPAFSPVAGFYCDRLEYFRWLFRDAYGRDLVAQFARHEDQGRLEVIGCAATHGFLPHLRAHPESVRAQIALGAREHERHLGRRPRGLWLPECGWFEGLDALLADAGIEYVFVDAHAVRNAASAPRLGTAAPVLAPAGVAAFGRDEECSVEVWSAKEGYPGDPAYRDFYRDVGFDLDAAYVAPYLDPAGKRGFTGLKYHRITGEGGHKEPYRRDAALLTAARHAGDFARKRAAQTARLAPALPRRPLLLAMYDAELFGHWWFEGPEWLEGVLRRLPEHGVRAVTPARYLEENPENQVAEPSGSSWGEGGYGEVWLMEENDWMAPPLEDAARRMAALAAAHPAPPPPLARLLAQAGRELLLAQSSDWPFILKNRTASEYARGRALAHLHRFDLLARQAESGAPDEALLAEIEARDNLFPDIDHRLWSPA
jgi:1,4-alpha-glucan branching enzyme